jgi:hypothetical protein
MKKQKKEKKFVLYIRNDDSEDLELRKVYEVIPDSRAAKDGYIRVVDESGEDYLYPESYFTVVTLSRKAQEAARLVG